MLIRNYFPSFFLPPEQHSANFSEKDQIANILGFANHWSLSQPLNSVTAAQKQLYTIRITVFQKALF